MKNLFAAATILLAATVSAFAPLIVPPPLRRSSSQQLNMVDLANGSMSFDRVCREWRCKYTGDKSTSKSLEAIAGVVDEYLPELKKVSGGVTVNRLVCGSCLDFKLQTTYVLHRWVLTTGAAPLQPHISHESFFFLLCSVPLEDFGPWEEKGFPPEKDFLAKLEAIDGVSQVETQTITNMVIS
jgi:hypothetical protein